MDWQKKYVTCKKLVIKDERDRWESSFCPDVIKENPTWQWHTITKETVVFQVARSDLPMSQAATRPQAKALRPKPKNQAQAASHLLPLGTHVMYKTSPNKPWYPRIVTIILQ